VINSGIGDSDHLVNQTEAVVLLEDFSEQEFDGAWNAIKEIVNDSNIKTKARVTAETVFDLKTVGGERYARLYESVFSA